MSKTPSGNSLASRDIASLVHPYTHLRQHLTNGPLVAELEERAAERLGVTRAVTVSSCTSGLMLAIQAVTEGARGHVLVPGFTFSASAHAVAWNGLDPRFVECTPDGFQMADDVVPVAFAEPAALDVHRARGIVAARNGPDSMLIHIGSQSPHRIAAQLQNAFKLPDMHFHVISRDTGGSFVCGGGAGWACGALGGAVWACAAGGFGR